MGGGGGGERGGEGEGAGGRADLLDVDVVQVVLDELHSRRQVGRVELVRDVPAQRAELAPLLHDGVQERRGVQHRLPLRHVGHVQLVLRTRTPRNREVGRRQTMYCIDFT